MAIQNIVLKISYDGRAYSGWAIQKDRPTVQRTVRTAFESLIGRKVNLIGSSRTDAGVSAIGQMAQAHVDTPVPADKIAEILNARLPEDIAVLESWEAKRGFNVIQDSWGKHYQYRIYTGQVRPVFEIRNCWHYPYELDVEKMNIAAGLFEGTKNFRSMATSSDMRKDSVRTIYRCSARRAGHWVTIDVWGNKFLYNMVRNMVGTLVEIGRGRWEPSQLDGIIAARDRRAAGMLAPAAGLCLMKIYYRRITEQDYGVCDQEGRS